MINKPIIALIAARSTNQVIGCRGKLPWNIASDLKYFKNVTTGYPVIMGRKTYQSIGRLLPNRHNIIITRQKDYTVDHATVVNSFEQAVAAAATATKLFVIGGAQIYKIALPYADQIWITEVEQYYQGDAYFPSFDYTKYKCTIIKQQSATEATPAVKYCLYTRR